ncbi:MAG: HAD-IA family hydrolase [Chthoniobacteraceae bacterium]
MTTADWGAVFDWDGVIIDSSRCHEESWERLAREERRSLPAGHFRAGFGRKNEFIIPEILGWTHDAGEIQRLALRKEELYRGLVREQGVEILPGVRSFLERLRDAAVPCVIGSSTHRANIDLTLGKIGLSSFFRDIVSAEDVQLGKPNPEVFLKAAARIGRFPEKCVVFEDAFAGLQAARNAGMKCVAVATTNDAASLAGHADRVVHRLDEIQSAELALWFA